MVLKHLLERIDEHAANRDDLALVIADEIDQANEYRRARSYSQRIATTGPERGSPQNRGTLHFAPSKPRHHSIRADCHLDRRVRLPRGISFVALAEPCCFCNGPATSGAYEFSERAPWQVGIDSDAPTHSFAIFVFRVVAVVSLMTNIQERPRQPRQGTD